MVKFTKKLTVKASPDQIWKVFAHDFNDAYKWMASVPNSYARSNGKLFDGAKSDGRLCELTTKENGMQASEQFLAYNEQEKTATVKIDFLNTPKGFPVRFNTLDFSMKDLGNGETEMTWKFRSRIKPLAYFTWPMLRIGFGKFVFGIMEELKHYVEFGTPHPRKVKAIRKQEKYALAKAPQSGYQTT